jgi:tetratricopeptide (TPR) repeat protein
MVAPLIDELDSAWQRGQPLTAEEVLRRHPEEAGDHEAALRLIYEELCLREAAGEKDAEEEVLARYPHHRDEVERLLGWHRLLGPAAPVFPEVGECLGEFRLLGELGRGALGRAYLASQPALADRAVVLKVTPCEEGEPRALARLQHTNIVPLYCLARWPERCLQGLCMPYLGGASLAALLEALAPLLPSQRSGRHLLEALARAAPPEGPARGGADGASPSPLESFYRQSSFAEVVCWVGACLADALHHAHQRGLVHLDVKPANVLLAADGQPMLLDFHLAQGPLRPGQPGPARLGGTPTYMAPEQKAAFDAALRGQPVPGLVDGRADVYALGLVLREALGDSMGPGLEAIVVKCLQPDPDRRYAEAGQLGEDLRRHLADLPLRGAHVTLRERWRKWRRRSGPAAVVTGVLVVTAAVAILTAFVVRGQAIRGANADLTEGQAHLAERRHREAARSFERGLARLNRLPGVTARAEALRLEHARAVRGMAADDLHHLVERLRLVAGAEQLSGRSECWQLDEQCLACWQGRAALRGPTGLAPALEEQAGADLLDLALLWADLRVRLGRDPAERKRARREAVRLLDEARAELGPSLALCQERAALTRAGGAVGVADEKGPAPGTAWEHTLVGRSLLRRGELLRARPHLEQAVAAAPGSFWGQFYLGACCFRQGDLAAALAAFHACVALSPHSAEAHYNRGLVHSALGQHRPALADLTRALALRPALAEAALERGRLFCRLQRFDEALADLSLARAHGAGAVPVLFLLALVHEGRGERAQALERLGQALQREPDHAECLALRGRLLGQPRRR